MVLSHQEGYRCTVKECERIGVLRGKRCRSRPKRNWNEVIKLDLGSCNLQLTEAIALERSLWTSTINITCIDPPPKDKKGGKKNPPGMYKYLQLGLCTRTFYPFFI